MPRKHKPRKTTPRRAAKGGRGRRPRPAFSSSQIRTKNVTRYTSTRRVRNWREKEKFEERKTCISGRGYKDYNRSLSRREGETFDSIVDYAPSRNRVGSMMMGITIDSCGKQGGDGGRVWELID